MAYSLKKHPHSIKKMNSVKNFTYVKFRKRQNESMMLEVRVFLGNRIMKMITTLVLKVLKEVHICRYFIKVYT
jgi:hypothetical protein